MAAMQSIATTTDDLENREISAAEIHGVNPRVAEVTSRSRLHSPVRATVAVIAKAR